MQAISGHYQVPWPIDDNNNAWHARLFCYTTKWKMITNTNDEHVIVPFFLNLNDLNVPF